MTDLEYAARQCAVGKFDKFPTRSSAAKPRRSRVRALATVSPLALIFGLTCLAVPAAAAPCTPFITACNAAGGDGPWAPRGGSGGEGNGGGGNGTTLDGGGATVATPGSASSSGNGGSGGSGDNGPVSGGSNGAVFFGSVTVNAGVTGDDGDRGWAGVNFATGGGGGGAGIYTTGGDLTISAVSVRGGDGGQGGLGTGGPSANGGGGGGGGSGLLVDAATSVINGGSITGGNGGAGGQGGYPGGGGGGGDGIVVTGSGATFTQYGTITGGQGGAGATSINGNSTAGDSGAGMNLIASSIGISNFGSIRGGDANGGAAGVGIMTNGSATIANSGVIAGGLNNDGVTRAAAIRFGGSNNLYFASTPTASLEGHVELIDGAAVDFAAFTGPTTYTNDFQLGSNSTLTFRALSGALSVSGVISGSGDVSKRDANSLTLDGTHTYTGATTVDAGLLVVNGSIASSSLLTVNNGASVGGNGILPTTVIANGAALAPGNSIGALTVNGDLTFNTTSAYNVEVSPSAADRTNVTNTANLAGAVNASYAPGAYVATRYTIISAAQISGSFTGGLTNTNLPDNLTAKLNYDASNVYLDLILAYQVPAGGLNRNQQNVANTLTNYFNSTGGIPTAFTTLTSTGLSQVSGEAGASLVQPMSAGINLFTTAVFDGAFGALGVAGPAENVGQSALGYAQAVRRPHAASSAIASLTKSSVAARWGIWASAYGGNSRVSGNAAVGSSTTTSKVYGAVAGATYRAGPTSVVGFALGGAGTSFSLDGGLGSGKSDVFHAALYGRHDIGNAYVAALLGYGWHDASTDRTVTAAGADVLHANFKPQSLSGRVEAGYRVAMPALDVTPYGALQMASFHLPGYGETATSGSGQFALSYASRTANAMRTELGLRLAKSYAFASGTLTLKGRAAWAHDSYSGRGATASFQTLPGTSFTVDGAEPNADVALLSAGAELGVGNGWSLAANFDGEFSGNSSSYAGKGTLRRVW
ncbi:MAG TPA: autotransporter domain-containing protein [Pseudolabrys sp.]|nr:autotransporter domain-containing protein [Pseudolabrys sp.]